jgi:hypothetical protein
MPFHSFIFIKIAFWQIGQDIIFYAIIYNKWSPAFIFDILHFIICFTDMPYWPNLPVSLISLSPPSTAAGQHVSEMAARFWLHTVTVSLISRRRL